MLQVQVAFQKCILSGVSVFHNMNLPFITLSVGIDPMGWVHIIFHNIQGGGIASARDREQLGWNFGNTFQPTSNTSNINLRDYVTTGDHIKIVRNSNTYYVENRRRLNFYSSSSMHKWRWTVNEPLMPLQADSGLYIYTSNNDEHCYHAYGKWNYSTCSPNVYKVLKPPYILQFIPETVNRYSGKRVMDLFKLSCKDFNCNTLYNTYFNPNLLISDASYIGVQGDSNTSFDVNYNEVFSPWSNPGISIGSSSDSLVIELDERHSNGSIDVNVYFTNLLQGEPSKPQFIKTSRQYLSSPPNDFKTNLTWLKNKEPDLKQYKIYRGQVQSGYFDAANYYHIGTTSDTFFVDNDILYLHGGGSGPCTRYYVNNFYRISAVDSSNKESVKSDRDSMSGYTDPCGPLGDSPSAENPDPSNINLKNDLMQNYPNPFNPITRITYILENEAIVNITLYDVVGRRITALVQQFQPAGIYSFDFNADNHKLSSGIYFYKLQAENFTQTKQMILLK